MDILNNSYITYENINGLIDITDDTLHNFSVNYGDILFQRSSETIEDVGKSNVYLDHRIATFGGFVIRGRKISDYDPLFLKYLLDGPIMRKRIIKLGQGAQHFNIGQENLKSIKLSMPKITEQEKIGSLFKLLDKKIEYQKEIINVFKSYKRGLFVRLFSTYYKKKISFFEIYEKASEGGTPSTSNQNYYTNGTIPFAKIEDLSSHYLTSTNSYITKDGLNNSSAWIIPTGSIIFSNGATIGACTINKIPVSTKQGILGIVLKDTYSSEYLYHYFTSDDFMHRIKSITTKGTIDCAYLKDINTIKFDVPDISDQKEIALIMNKLDAIIEKNIDLFLKIQYLKKGMLQRLFI